MSIVASFSSLAVFVLPEASAALGLVRKLARLNDFNQVFLAFSDGLRLLEWEQLLLTVGKLA